MAIDHNHMTDAVVHSERARAEYSRMQSNLESMQSERDQAIREKDLLLAEVGRNAQHFDRWKDDMEARLNFVENERDRYMRFAVEMSTQLSLLESMIVSQSLVMSDALKHAVEASKAMAFEKPVIKEADESQGGGTSEVVIEPGDADLIADQETPTQTGGLEALAAELGVPNIRSARRGARNGL